MKYKNLAFPLKGLNRKWSYQTQPEYTTPDALNVRPYTTADNRLRGGSRPGTGPWASYQFPGKVNLLTTVNGSQYRFVPGEPSDIVPPSDGTVDRWISRVWSDDFKGESVNPIWVPAFGCVLPDVSGNPPNGKFHDPVAAVRKNLTYSTNDPRTVAMQVSSISGWGDNGDYSLYLGLDESMAENTGVCATLHKRPDKMEISVRVKGQENYRKEVMGSRVGMLSITMRKDGSASVGYNGMSQFTSQPMSMTGTLFGFRLDANAEGDVAAIDMITFEYYELIDAFPPNPDEEALPGKIVLDKYADIVMVGSNGELYYAQEGYSTRGFTPVNAPVKTQQRDYVMCQKRLRQLYVADYGDYKGIGTDGTITGGVLTSASITDWEARRIVSGSDIVTISNAVTGVEVGSYIVESVSAAGVKLKDYKGQDGTCAFSVCVSPKVYDHSQKSYVPYMGQVGMVPVNCPIICLYRDRIVLAGAESEPHLWYMSRQGDPYDWNFTQDIDTPELDRGIAVAGQNTDAGIIGEPIRAIVPHSDDYLVFGYDSSLWILRGDPADGGRIDNLSRTVGIVGRRAWCYGHSGEVVFLAKDGIYSLTGGNAFPEVVSRAVLPDELLGLSYDDNVQMSYDIRYHGVHIYVEGRKRNWFFSLDTDSFWPVEFSSGLDVSATLENRGEVLVGSVDGRVRHHDRRLVSDDGIPFDSYVLIGPVRIGENDYSNGVIQRTDSTMVMSEGNSLDVEVFTGREASEAAEQYKSGRTVYSFRLDRKLKANVQRIRAGSAIFKVGQYEKFEWWGMERMGIYLKYAGRFRE